MIVKLFQLMLFPRKPFSIHSSDIILKIYEKQQECGLVELENGFWLLWPNSIAGNLFSRCKSQGKQGHFFHIRLFVEVLYGLNLK